MAATGSPAASQRGRFTRPLDAGAEPASVVGARGAALSRMQSLGLPVPPCFAITVDAFRAWRAAGETMPAEVWREMRARLGEVGRALAVRVSPTDRPPGPPTAPAGEAPAPAERLPEAVEGLWRRYAEEVAAPPGD